MRKLTYRFMLATHYDDANDVIYFFKTMKESQELMETLEFLNIGYTLSEIPKNMGSKVPQNPDLN